MPEVTEQSEQSAGNIHIASEPTTGPSRQRRRWLRRSAYVAAGITLLIAACAVYVWRSIEVLPSPEAIAKDIDAGRYESALKSLDQAERFYQKTGVLVDPAWIWGERGYIYSRQDRYRDAVAALDMAISLEPDAATYYQTRGIAHEELGDMARAESDFDQAVALDPENPVRYRERGYFYQNVNRLADAVSDFSTAIRLSPQDGALFLARAEALIELRDSGKCDALPGVEFYEDDSITVR